MTEFLMPPVRTTEGGDERRVGFEIEYAGVDIEDAVACVQAVVGGRIKRRNPFHYDIADTELGSFVVEVDARLLHEQAYETYLQRVGIDIDQLELRAPLERMLGSLAAIAVPQEVVTPPLPLSRLGEVDAIRQALYEAEAKGTRESLLFGFGLHINPDLPGTGVGSLLAHVRAYALLHDWIEKQSAIDWSRRIGPYINRYPDAYLDLIMGEDYAPDRSQFAADYVEHMPSRNHALDMLPALVELEGEGLLSKLKEPELNKPRPTFHYRLPNCLIGDPEWRIAEEWRRWVAVEELAADADRLAELMQRYRSFRASWTSPVLGSWVKEVEQFMGSDG